VASQKIATINEKCSILSEHKAVFYHHYSLCLFVTKKRCPVHIRTWRSDIRRFYLGLVLEGRVYLILILWLPLGLVLSYAYGYG